MTRLLKCCLICIVNLLRVNKVCVNFQLIVRGGKAAEIMRESWRLHPEKLNLDPEPRVLCGQVFETVMECAAHDAVLGYNNQEGGYPDNLGLLIFKAHLLAVALLLRSLILGVLKGWETIVLFG